MKKNNRWRFPTILSFIKFTLNVPTKEFHGTSYTEYISTKCIVTYYDNIDDNENSLPFAVQKRYIVSPLLWDCSYVKYNMIHFHSHVIEVSK